jgi:hypothetical protein
MRKIRGGMGAAKAKQQAPRPWEPSPEQLEIYYAALAGNKSYAQVSRDFKKAPNYVSDLIRQIDAWLVPQWMDRIREIKSNHSQRLMVIYRESMQQWFASKEKKGTWKKKDDKFQLERVESQSGDQRHLKTAMEALRDIRLIWGMQAPEKVEGETVLRIGGLDRREAIRRRKAELDEADRVESEHSEE